MPSYPDRLEITPLRRPPSATVRVPGSKSITNRALVLAAQLSKGTDAEIHGALRCEDTDVMIECLRKLGHYVQTNWSLAKPLVVVNSGDHSDILGFNVQEADLYTANSGTTMRFLTAMVSRGCGRFRLDGTPRMRERPIEDLLLALQQLGVNAYSENRNGRPPVVVEANGLKGGSVRIKGNTSSQFLSALLMVAPEAGADVEIEVDGMLVSWPYVEMTVQLMHEAGYAVEVVTEPVFRFHIPRQHCYGMPPVSVEPDASAASYFLAAAAISGGNVCVAGLGLESIQGDLRFVELLEQMGCRLLPNPFGLDLEGGPLRGIDADMNDISDTVMTLAAVACFAEGPTTIRNVAHIRHKETDRLAALAAELRRVGAGVDEFADGLTITPRPLHGAEIETYNDHRMAMSMALIGLKVPGVVIKDPGCVAKTYPGFFADLEKLR